jgi:Flp pilus assembly protein TadG
MGSLSKLLREDDGTELIEAAVVMPVYLLLLFGTIAFGLVMFGWCNITFASRAAVRYASTHSNASLVPATPDTVTAVAAPFLLASVANGTSTMVTYGPSNVVGGTVTVTVTAQYSVVMPFTSYTLFTVSSTAKRTITR